MNALAAYGSSSSSSGSEPDEAGEVEAEAAHGLGAVGQARKPLPAPGFAQGRPDVQHSVFANPFAQAERAKAQVLEKHVKMVPVKDQTLTINGKKICWNYRKGRCRFGHNCKFAHDSDIQKTSEELEAEKQSLKSVVCEKTGSQSVHPPPLVHLENINNTSDDRWEGNGNKPKLKRPGLSQGIVPGKKVLKMYKQQKTYSSKK